MQINVISTHYAVSPQISPSDAKAIAKAGYKSVICNRPDSENPANLHILEVCSAVEAAGMTFAAHPFSSQNFSQETIDQQAELLRKLPTPILAYCATGTRCSVIWSFVQANANKPVDEIHSATTSAGYALGHLNPQLIQCGAKEG